MSSHHFVREGQEPAVIFLSLDDALWSVSGHLLEWSPVVYAAPITEEYLKVKSVYIDQLLLQNIHTLSKKDITIFWKDIVSQLKSRKQYAATIVCHSTNLEKLIQLDSDLQISYLTESFRQIQLKKFPFSKWFGKGTDIELYNTFADKWEKTSFENDQLFVISEKSNMVWLREYFHS